MSVSRLPFVPSHLFVAVSSNDGRLPYYRPSSSSTYIMTGGSVGVLYVDSSWSGNRVSDILEFANAPQTRMKF